MDSEMPKIVYDKTFTHVIKGFGFGNIPQSLMIEILRDGRPFSHFIESWLSENYPLQHIKGCKPHDHVNIIDETIKYEQKTFTSRGCNFMQSKMIGTGRSFKQETFEEHAKTLIYIIVSNIHFPEIKIKFVKGENLIIKYPKGKIPSKDFVKFFD